MTAKEAIYLAVSELQERGNIIASDPPPVAVKANEDIRLVDNREGWLVLVSLALLDEFEGNTIRVEVYEPEGDIFIHKML